MRASRCFQLRIERMIAGHEPRGAGADAVALDRPRRPRPSGPDGGSGPDSRCTRTTGASGRCAPARGPRCGRSGQGSAAGAIAPARRACGVRIHRGRTCLPYTSRPMDWKHWYAGRARSRLAALCADEDRAAAACGGAHRGLPHRAGRRPRADRRHRLVVDRLPRLQPSAYPAGGGAAACRHAACDVRRAGARAGADAGAAAGRRFCRAISTGCSFRSPGRSRSRSP